MDIYIYICTQNRKEQTILVMCQNLIYYYEEEIVKLTLFENFKVLYTPQ
jgi:hypothetical protein